MGVEKNLINSSLSTLMQLLLSLDEDMRVKKTLIQTIGCKIGLDNRRSMPRTISYSLSILTDNNVCSLSLCRKTTIHSIPLRSIVLNNWPRSDDTLMILAGPSFTLTVRSGIPRLHSAAVKRNMKF